MFVRFLAAVVAVGCLALAGALPALATSDTNTSEPTGALTITASLASTTNKDKDGNPDTATKGDEVTASYAITNNADGAQTVTVTYRLDAPGVAYDETVTEQVDLAAGETHTEALTYRINRDFPLGTYQATVTADGSEVASATVSLTVH